MAWFCNKRPMNYQTKIVKMLQYSLQNHNFLEKIAEKNTNERQPTRHLLPTYLISTQLHWNNICVLSYVLLGSKIQNSNLRRKFSCISKVHKLPFVHVGLLNYRVYTIKNLILMILDHSLFPTIYSNRFFRYSLQFLYRFCCWVVHHWFSHYLTKTKGE